MLRTVWILSLTLLVINNGTAPAAEPRVDRCVILISVDGLANFYLDDPLADIPTIRQLVAEGARADGIVCSFPTVTWPNHTTLVTGVGPGKHGVLGNNYLDRASATKVALIPDPLFYKDHARLDGARHVRRRSVAEIRHAGVAGGAAGGRNSD